MGTPVLIPLDFGDISASSVPTPPSGYLSVFSEGGKLKQKDSTGVVTDLTATGGGGGGSPGGADTQVQFNDGGLFGGVVSFIFNKVTNLLTVTKGYFTDTLGVGKTNDGSAAIDVKSLNAGSKQGLRIEGDNIGNTQFSTFLTADTFTRFSFLVDGLLKWGSGTAAPDTNLYRGGVNILKTDDRLEVDSLAMLGADAEFEMQGITNEPAAPIAGRMYAYAKSIAGRMFLKVMGPSGFDVILQAHSFHNTIQLWQAGATTAISIIGNTVTNVGTISHPAIADTNLKTRTRRALNTSVATVGGLASTRPVLFECNRNSGFYVVSRFSLDTLQAGMRAFVGLTDTATTAPTNIDPTTSTTPGKIGMAINANTGNWNLVHNITGTAPTVIALGANFPVDATTMYELVLFSASAGSSVGYRITNQTTNATTSGTLSTNLPALATLLGRTIWATNNATAAAVAWSMSKFGLETDY